MADDPCPPSTPWPAFTLTAPAALPEYVLNDPACPQLLGVDMTTLPIETAPQFILGYKDGCLVRVAVGTC